MSQARSRREDGDTTTLFDKDSSDILQLGRHTPSAIPRNRQSRGFEGIIASFSKSKQNAVRQLCLERLDVEQRIDLFKQRLEQSNQSNHKPAALQELEEQHRDNTYRLRKLSGTAFGTLLAVLDDPEIREALTPEIQFEEEMDNGGLWRRRLVSNRSAKPVSGYRNTSHDHPTFRGTKGKWDELNSADPNAGASYYERQQLKYGRARRGSTSIAGAWEEVLNNPSNQTPPEALDQGNTGDDAVGTSKEQVGNVVDEKPSRVAAEAATKKAQQLSSPGYKLLTPTEAAANPEKSSATRNGEQDLDALLNEAQDLVDSYHGRNRNGAAADSRNSGANHASTTRTQNTQTSSSPNALSALAASGNYNANAVSRPSFARFGSRRGLDARPDEAASHHGSKVTGFSHGGESFRITNSTAVVPTLRTTPSAHGFHRRTRGLEALIASHSLRSQHMIRELACDYLEALMRYESVVERNNDDDKACPEVKSEVTELLEDTLKDRKAALVKAVGHEEANVILSHLTDPDVRAELGFHPESEDLQADEDSMRKWRRKLLRMKQVKKNDHGGIHSLHDSPTGSGAREIWNRLNREDDREGLSYYQRQQLRYGRGRRGSTSIAGAWESMFQEAKGGDGSSSDEESVVPVYVSEEAQKKQQQDRSQRTSRYDQNVKLVEEALSAAKSGDQQKMFEAATTLANALQQLRTSGQSS